MAPAPTEGGSSSHSRRPCRWPAGLVGALGLILLMEGVLGKIPPGGNQRSRLAASWQAALRSTEGPEAQAEILCFGDSLMKLGILPQVLEARLGQSAYNLAVLGGQPPTSHCLLQRVLEQGRAPRALVVNFSPLLLAMDPGVNIEWWAGRVEWRERFEAMMRCRDPGLVLSLMLHGAFGSLSSRGTCRSLAGFAAFEPSDDDDRPPGGELRALARNWSLNRGAQLAPREFVPIRGSLSRPYDGTGWAWRVKPVHAYFVERFLAMVQERGIPVYWIIPPAESGWLERNERVGTVGAYRRYVQDLVARFPVLTVFDLQRAGWDRGLFRDPIHLNRDGAVRLSLAVADAIARDTGPHGAAGRWIAMDGRAPAPVRPSPESLEDLDQSRLAVRRGESGPITMEGPRR